ncbi:glycoside hydrolase family 31 protein [Lentibacillus saliphilus]|uniref:glycoside hydrolase family 31 protein n=1 Tax=Lentibacillus saliphilus TaxID=2737028 RepID=UPI0031BAFBA1
MTKAYSKEIVLNQGELWWGGLVEDGKEMPYHNTFSRQLYGDLRYNQGAPFLVSNKGRFVWSEEPIDFTFDSGVLKIEGSSEIICEDTQKQLKDAYVQASETYFPPSNQMPDAAFFSYPQFNTWMEMNYEPTQEKVLQFANDILNKGFPPGILMIDDGWQEDFGVWNFHSGRFPNPKAMVEELRELGFKVMVWLCPFISPDSYASRMLHKQGCLIQDQAGEPVIRKWWNGYSAILDCSNAAAVKWIEAEMDALMTTYDIDGFKMDGGDPQYYRQSDVCHQTLTPNEHSLKWAEIGLKYPFNEYRACWKLGNQPLVQRLSDKNHSWDALKSLVPNGIAQGLMGYPFICPDMIGGGQYDDLVNPEFVWDQELFVRYAQCSALFPMMQFSTAPWRVLDQTHLNYCLEAVKIHESMSSSINELAKHAARTGEPIVRHMAYHFNASEYADVKDQFMLGEDVLVAPVLEKGVKERTIVFPAGTWIGDDGTQVNGPCRMSVTAPISRLPYYKRMHACV